MKHETPAEAGASLRARDGSAPSGDDGSTGSWVFDGYSQHPTPDGYCDRPKQLRNLETNAVLMLACATAIEALCGPCSRRYRRRVRRIAFGGGIKPGRLVVVTLTAPGRQIHTYKGGRKVCPCTKRATDVGVWNGTLTKRANHWLTDLRRMYGLEFQYFKAVEVQERGALHLHLVLRVTAGQDRLPNLTAFRNLAMRHGFGHEVVVDAKSHDMAPEVALAVAWYCSKYVAKAAGERQQVPYVHPKTGERVGRRPSHLVPIERHDGSRGWVDPETGEMVPMGHGARWRTWTSSHHWGRSMRDVKREEYEWRCAREAERLSESEGRRLAGVPLAPQAPLDPESPSYAPQTPLPLYAGNLEPM
jgi:hypothetical protein